MRLVITRARNARLTVNGELISSIEKGLVVYVGITQTDTVEIAKKAAAKVAKMRLFRDDEGRLNLNVSETGGQIMCVSNFTIYGKTDHGNRPDYSLAASAEQAKPIYDVLCDEINKFVSVAKGIFGAHMEIEMVVDGPVNLIAEYN